MTLRLTNIHREQIIREALQHRLGDEQEELKSARAALAKKLYSHFVPKALEKKLRELPSAFVRMGKSYQVMLGAEWLVFDLETEHPLQVDRYSNSVLGQINPQDDLGIEIARLQQRQTKLKEDKESIRTSLKTLLSSFATLPALSKAWPEGGIFFENIKKEQGIIGLPSVRVSDINEKLGLV